MNIGHRERIVSAVSGVILAGYGIFSLFQRKPARALSFLAFGGGLLSRGAMGRCPVYKKLGINTTDSTEPSDSIRQTVEKSTLIHRSAADLYQVWHDFAGLPQFMENITSVHVQNETRSHWVAHAPLGKTVEWDAEITADEPDQRIAWKSLPGADIDGSGTVTFTPTANADETRVTVSFSYRLPLGSVGTAAATLLGAGPEKQMDNTLRRFKSLMEAGEIPTTRGQPSGPRSPLSRLLQKTKG